MAGNWRSIPTTTRATATNASGCAAIFDEVPDGKPICSIYSNVVEFTVPWLWLINCGYPLLLARAVSIQRSPHYRSLHDLVRSSQTALPLYSTKKVNLLVL
eukprot:2651074-Heterocapsa_arctica.AAC.1